MGLLIRLFSCITFLVVCLYSTIDQHNKITKLRFSIPLLTKQIQEVEEENTRLQYEIESFENPLHLMELARRSEYGHLKHPLIKEVMVVNVGEMLTQPIPSKGIQELRLPSKLSLASVMFLEPLKESEAP